LIILTRIGQLGLLERLSANASVPDAVIREVQSGLANDPSAATTVQWTAQRRLADLPIPGSVAVWGLGAGESQVIAHCLGNQNTAVFDDLAARRCALVHGISMIGTLGIILAAKRAGLVPLARPLLKQAVIAGLYLDAQLVQGTLASIGE
jgi:Predicted nucleic acid-binding protein, contains PIN domain